MKLMRPVRLAILPGLLLFAALAGCSGDDGIVVPSSTPSSTVDIELNDGEIGDPLDFVPGGGLLGSPCDFSAECRAGLICDGGICDAPGDKPEGSTCLISAECQNGLACTVPASCQEDFGSASGLVCTPVCSEVGDGVIDDLCFSNLDCGPALFCDFVGIVGTCAPTGASDVSEDCDSTEDCAAGLLCREGSCNDVLSILTSLGEARECDPDDGTLGRVFFEVPPPGEAVSEFYRLPFPNDIRRTDETIDLSGHPVIGKHLYNLDPAQRLVDAVEQGSNGYSGVAPVYFRFSRAIKLDGVVIGKDQNALDTIDTVALIDITPTSEEYGKRKDISWSAEMGAGSGGRYICDNWLMIRPLYLRPLKAGNTYAAVVMKGLQDAEGNPIVADADFTELLGSQSPSDSMLINPWQKYKPLRDFLVDGSVELPVKKERLLGASVFTVGNPGKRIRAIRQTVSAGPGPNVRDVTRCDEATPSGCELPSGQQGCFGTAFGYDELHGRLDLPRLRGGDSNFLYPELGGAVGTSPAVQGMEETCFALSVPNGVDMPEDGWPLVIYGHGVLGDRSAPYQDGTVEDLVAIQGDPGVTGAAVLSIDQLFHGSRAIEGPFGPEFTFQNLGNPAAISGNVLQAVAEYFQLERLVSSVNWSSEESPTGQSIKFDLSRVYLYGHSIGAKSGLVAASESLLTQGVVMGGIGGGIPLSLMNRTNPAPLGGILGLYFADIRPSGLSRVDQNNPIMSLLQHAAGPADPLVIAEKLLLSPTELTPAKHVLLLWGVGDTYESDVSVKSLASAMRLAQIEPFEEKIDGVITASAPLSGNWPVGMTGVVSDHVPVGYDGHFILQSHQDARRQAVQFIGTAITEENGTPTLVP